MSRSSVDGLLQVFKELKQTYDAHEQAIRDTQLHIDENLARFKSELKSFPINVEALDKERIRTLEGKLKDYDNRGRIILHDETIIDQLKDEIKGLRVINVQLNHRLE